MSSDSLPGWAAPLAGIALGAAIGLGVNFQDSDSFNVLYPLIGGGIGLFAGLILFVADLIRRKSAGDEDDEDRPRRRRPAKDSGKRRQRDDDY